MYINNFLYLIVATHEDTRSVVDTLGNNIQDALHAAVDCLAASWDEIKLATRAYLYNFKGTSKTYIFEDPMEKTLGLFTIFR